MIRSFACKQTEKLFHDERPIKRLPKNLWPAMRRKLLMLDATESIDDLTAVPGNRCEALSGDRAGQWSIRVNRQWRACFLWDEEAADANDVEIVDYH